MKPADAIQHLLSQGWTEAEIARQVGAHQSTVNRIKNGGEPSWQVGSALINLAKRVRRRPPSQRAA